MQVHRHLRILRIVSTGARSRMKRTSMQRHSRVGALIYSMFGLIACGYSRNLPPPPSMSGIGVVTTVKRSLPGYQLFDCLGTDCSRSRGHLALQYVWICWSLLSFQGKNWVEVLRSEKKTLSLVSSCSDFDPSLESA